MVRLRAAGLRAADFFAVVFLAEFGDLTQLLTISLAARFHDPLAVGVGATLALWVAAGLAVTLGWRVLKRIPMRWLTRGAAVVMLVLAATTGYAAASRSPAAATRSIRTAIRAARPCWRWRSRSPRSLPRPR